MENFDIRSKFIYSLEDYKSDKIILGMSIEQHAECADAITKRYANDRTFIDTQKKSWINNGNKINSINCVILGNIAFMALNNKDDPFWMEKYNSAMEIYKQIVTKGQNYFELLEANK